MLQLLDPDKYNIATIQEPYLDHKPQLPCLPQLVHPIPERTLHHSQQNPSIMLINQRILTNNWSQIDLTSSDVTTIQMQTPLGPIIIINM